MHADRIVVSPSQLSTADSCLRKWWFQYSKRLPQIEKDYFTFGTVLHGVIERFMSADELGRDRKTGQPIDLYPAGWDTVPARVKGGPPVGVSPMEADLIKRMITKAIETGIIVRDPRVKIEHRFTEPLCIIDGVEVMLTGIIDWMDDTGITDHKTMKTSRYALGPERLSRDLQLLTYAAVFVDTCERLGRTIPGKVRLRHNQFSKDPERPEVRFSETYVEYSAIAAQHERNKVLAGQMLEVRGRDRWDAVPGPNDPGACNSYGGCPFMSICSGKETVENYSKRVLKQESKSVPSPKQEVVSKNQGDTKVATFEEMLAKRRAAAGLTQPATQPAAQPATQPAPAAKAAETKPAPAAAAGQTPAPAPTVAKVVGAAPPWADPACKACLGTGFSSQGRPCRVCDALSKGAGRRSSSEFSITVLNGAYVWYDKANGTAVSSDPVVPVAVKQTEKIATAPAAAPAAAVQEAPAAAPATMPEKAAYVDPQPTTVEKIKPAKAKAAPEAPVASDEAAVDAEDADVLPSLRRGRGRPVKTFTLFVNCFPTRGFGRTVSGEEVLREAYARVVAEWNRENPTKAVESPFELNAFVRRDAAKVVIPKLLGQLSSADNLVVTSRDPDMADALGIFRAHATSVVEAIS